MKVPETIYTNYIGYGVFDEPTTMRVKESQIEYTRTDAFIEQALKFLDGCIPDYINLKQANVDTFIDVDNERFIEDFKNHIKGK